MPRKTSNAGTQTVAAASSASPTVRCDAMCDACTVDRRRSDDDRRRASRRDMCAF